MSSRDDELAGYTPASDGTDPEDLDEDRLKLDPLEAGMDPPEHWSGADKYGTTPYEQAHARPLADRLAEEQGDAEPVTEFDEEAEAEAERRGQAADESGGSVASATRQPESGL